MKGLAKTRDSNMELLRIFAMFLVMIFHIDFMSIDGIDPINPALHPINSFIRIFLSLASFTCVDIFVLLSGWYGIHLKSTKLKSFLFQVFFFSILSYGCFVLYGKENILDLFGGSGSTLIACEQLDKRCFIMELLPEYVDVIIQRWENFTGEKAVLLNREEEE